MNNKTPKKFNVLFEKITNPFRKNKPNIPQPDLFDEDEDSEDNAHDGEMKMLIFGGMPGQDSAEKFDILINNYNMYNLHTNFWISDKIYKILNYTDGVEMVEVTSPYRARIVFGKAFDETEVRKTIQKKLTDFLIKGKGKGAMANIKQTLNKLPQQLELPDFTGEQPT